MGRRREALRNETRLSQPALAIHGGAGTLARADMTPRESRRYRSALDHALAAGWRVLGGGGSSLDAVCAAVVALEDCPLFNAGRGAVFNAAGRHEFDASVMNGATLEAGAVAAIRHAKNPVLVARAVMERTSHIVLAGAGAERFARTQGFKAMPERYFYTRRRWAALERTRRAGRALGERERHGTVGAVARDCAGDLAAATSTGGYTNKMAGRVGDSAQIGAGTYADNATCAVSTTGHGETFIRAMVAHDIAARLSYGGQTLRQAVDAALHSVAALGASGGVIAVGRRGAAVFRFNSEGMYRARVSVGRRAETAVY